MWQGGYGTEAESEAAARGVAPVAVGGAAELGAVVEATAPEDSFTVARCREGVEPGHVFRIKSFVVKILAPLKTFPCMS